MNRRGWALLAVLTGGCGAAMRPPESATSGTMAPDRDEARTEIARLQGRIAAQRDALGLPAPVVETPPGESPREEEAKPQVVMSEPTVRPAPVMTNEAAPQSAPSWRWPRSDGEETKPAERKRTTRCRDVAAAADEICGASSRICSLAAQLAEDEARRSCDLSQTDCRQARTLSDSCR